MERQIYNKMSAVEDTHWWFRARRTVSEWMLRQAKLPAGARILDVGCGSGGNLKLLSRYGQVEACEYDNAMRTLAQKRGIAPVEPVHLPESIPFQPGGFDMITLFDVLEHVEEDKESLNALSGMLNPGGYILLTVPAFMFLWGTHDVMHHHKRRYHHQQLESLLAGAGFQVKQLNYFNFWLFPVTYLLRKLCKNANEDSSISGTATPTKWLNFLLYQLAASERFFYPFMRLPFGSTLIVLAQKRPSA